MHTTLLVAGFVVLLGITACEKTATGPDPDSDEALEGLWRYTAVGDLERTIEFFADGTFFLVEVDWDAPACGSAAGTWGLDTPDRLTLRYTERDGAPVSEPADALPYFIDSVRLVVTFPESVAPQAHARLAGTMPTCADYGWMSLTMFAEIDGVLTDFSVPGLFADLGSDVADGFTSISGYYDPDGLGFDPGCATCQVLTLDLFHELGAALTTGTYPVETFGETGLRSEGTYVPDLAAFAQFGTNDSDPATQPWSGQVLITEMTAEAVAGSFEFVVYDAGGAGPPYPSVTVTNGSFRLSFD